MSEAKIGILGYRNFVKRLASRARRSVITVRRRTGTHDAASSVAALLALRTHDGFRLSGASFALCLMLRRVRDTRA